jgi:tetratricopeptide (TPR) repeat protein
MIVGVAACKALSNETVTAVVERTGGVPLFVEELTRVVLESGDNQLATKTIPITLNDSLMARLDRLGTDKEVLQIAAVLGTEFSYALLCAVHPIPESEIERALRRLTEAELLYVRGIVPQANYQFKHALIRDAAYEGLLKSRRRYLHEQIIQILEERFPEIATAKPELVAHHCIEAQRVGQAVRYCRRAGRKAIERSANTEAIIQFRKALELVEALPPTSETVQEEIRLRMALTAPLIATKGYTAPEVEQECNRALSLCQQIGDTPYLHAVLGGLGSIYFNRSELEICLELAKRMLRLAETWRDRSSLLWAHYFLGFTLASQGKLRIARDHLQQCIALYDPNKGGSYRYVQEPGPTAMAMLSRVVYQLGYPDEARKKVQEALSLARTLSRPYSLAWVLGHAGWLYWERGEKSAAQECWKERASISFELGFKPLLEDASFALGYALAEQEEGSNGIEKSNCQMLWIAPTRSGGFPWRGLV